MYDLKNMSKEEAQTVCTWHYEGEYAVYDLPSYDEALKQQWGIGQDKIRQKEFYTIYLKEELIGYFRLQETCDDIRLGIGLRPDYCGQGHSKQILSEIDTFIHQRYNKKIRLLVRPFNKRAQAAYLKAGFEIIEKTILNTTNGEVPFIIMEKQ
ncbi:GNAT family N-acetyltransferase [Beduini massiliensis]|uniref:GNAT family N-acetyltransferase n=1 Tax=Beduini massiliensis TaxID=1585974 RepID=UPI00059A8117|nr:GNAT family N-acetyltransferase [Beduini massiliensis]